MQNVPLQRPFAVRSGQLPAQGRGGLLERPGSAGHSAAASRLTGTHRRGRLGADRGPRRRGDRGGRRLCAVLPRSDPRPAGAARLLGGNAMRKLTIVEALREAMREEMTRDSSVILLGEDVGVPQGFGGAFTVSLGLSDEFGHERVIDTPISEAGYAGMAVGAALAGLRPIVDLQYADFIYCMMDQIVNEAAKLTYMSAGQVRVPLVVRAPVGASTRGAQHSQTPEAMFMHVPGLKVVAPSTAYDAKGLLKTAIRDDNPVIFLEHKLLYGSKGTRVEKGSLSPTGDVPDDEYTIPFGQAIIRRPGSDMT